jgi:hypothetical protein
MSSRLFPLVILVGLAFAGCHPTPNMRGPQTISETYETMLRRWTQSGQVYQSLDSMLVVHATYLSPQFRQAFGEQYLKIFGIDPGKADSDLEQIATSIGRGHEFFVFTDTHLPEWNNLEARDSVWRLGLWGGPDQLGVAPLAVYRFAGRGPNLKAFFPYLNLFGRSFLVIFPLDQPNGKPILDPENGTLTVRLASAYGTASLSWKVKE